MSKIDLHGAVVGVCEIRKHCCVVVCPSVVTVLCVSIKKTITSCQRLVCICVMLSLSDYLFKLLLIGDSGVGKSCLLLRFAVSQKVNKTET